eukprot:gene7864-12083_t
MSPAPTKQSHGDDNAADSFTAGKMYQFCTHKKSDHWFGIRDCSWRYTLTCLLHYWSLMTAPFDYLYYIYHHNLLWYGTMMGTVLTLLTPVLPVGIAVLVCYKYIESFFKPDWSMAGPGRVFFVKPKKLVAAFLWDCYLKQSMLVGQFYLVGTHDAAIRHTWVDTILTKDYWRDALDSVNGRLPRELGRWKDGVLRMNYPLGSNDVVIKLPDSFLGIGDAFWTHKEDFDTVESLEERLNKEYKDKEALVLELVRPCKSLGVHSFDIVTLRTPQDDVKVLSCLLWADCTSNSSHSCQAGYCVDVETETIVSAAAWYSPYFAHMDAPLIGTQLKGVRNACRTAVNAHKACKEKWLTAVGWDAMLTNKDEIVFFEGNFAGARAPRRMFLSLRCLLEFVKSYAWPFGYGGSMRPGVQ